MTSEDALGGDLLKKFLKQHGAYLHILDPSELMALMRAAGHIASLGKKTSKMMAFDAMLIERWQKAVDLDSPNFNLKYSSCSDRSLGRQEGSDRSA